MSGHKRCSNGTLLSSKLVFNIICTILNTQLIEVFFVSMQWYFTIFSVCKYIKVKIHHVDFIIIFYTICITISFVQMQCSTYKYYLKIGRRKVSTFLSILNLLFRVDRALRFLNTYSSQVTNVFRIILWENKKLNFFKRLNESKRE